MEGVKTITERVEGLGGGFTFCTLGDTIVMGKLLTRETLAAIAPSNFLVPTLQRWERRLGR